MHCSVFEDHSGKGTCPKSLGAVTRQEVRPKGPRTRSPWGRYQLARPGGPSGAKGA